MSLKPDKENLQKYINFGGLPELFNLQSSELQYSYIEALKNSIMLKDIVKRYKINDVALLEKIFLFLVDNISNLFSINSIVRKFKGLNIKTNTVTLANYLRYIESTFILTGVDRYDLKGKKIIEGEKKYYLNDLSFINFLTSGFESNFTKNT